MNSVLYLLGCIIVIYVGWIVPEFFQILVGMLKEVIRVKYLLSGTQVGTWLHYIVIS
jgi:hypothetical protein